MRAQIENWLQCEFPFKGTYIKELNKNEGRMKVRFHQTRKKMNLSRYLMCVKEGRILRPDEHVHHIDEDKTNDSINNLEILNSSEHAILHHTTGITNIGLYCSYCKKLFQRVGWSVKRNNLNSVYCDYDCFILHKRAVLKPRQRVKVKHIKVSCVPITIK